MKRRIVSQILSGQDVCLFCSLRPRYTPRQRSLLSPQITRCLSTTDARSQQPAVKESEEDDDDGDRIFTMLKQNAHLQNSFPSRPKPKPVAPSPPHPPPPPPAATTLPLQPTRSESAGEGEHLGGRFGRPLIRRDSSKRDLPQEPFSRPQKSGQVLSRLEGDDTERTLYPTRRRSNREQEYGFGNTSAQRGDYRSVRDGGREEQARSQVQRTPSFSQEVDLERPRFAIRRRMSRGHGEDNFRSDNFAQRPTDYTRSGANDPYARPSIDSQADGQSAARSRELFGSRSSNRQPYRPAFADREPFPSRRDPPARDQNSDSRRDPFQSRRPEIEAPSERSYSDRNRFSRPEERRPASYSLNLQKDEIASPVSAEAKVGDIDAPAGSSFDTNYGDALRHMQRSRRSARSDRLEVEEEDEDQASQKNTKPQVQIPARDFDFEMEEAEAMLYGDRGRKKKKNKAPRIQPAETQEATRPEVRLPEFISVERLARLMKVSLDQFVEKLEEEGFEGARYDHVLDSATSTMFADLYGFEPVVASPGAGLDIVARPLLEDTSVLPPRPPIVTIMGHVDHGKTTILDYLRKSSVVATEHGGITQHIGAFSVTMPGTNRQITFLDTPGHAAFLEMRRRGANVTDIVVLVVAADDSVKPQTIEAIKHALEANVQLIVAINKVDKADADIERVKQDLTRHEIVVEDYGGDYQAIALSGKTGQGMDQLEEAIITLADVSDFRAEADGPVEGWVLESKVTAAGRVATVLVRRGTLRTGDLIVAGTTWARVKTLRNDAGALVSEAPPGTPVQVDGWRAGDPDAGMEVLQANDEDHAKDVVALRLEQEEIAKTATDLNSLNTSRTEDAEARAKVLAWEAEQEWASKSHRRRPKDNVGWVDTEKTGGIRGVPFVIKADVAGSAEAVTAAVLAIGNNEITANVIHSAVGEVTEFDVRRLAVTGDVGYIVNFNQSVDHTIAKLAEAAGLKILNHNIIYKVTDDVKEKLAAELPPIITQRVLGEAEVGQIFDITVKRNKVKIAGCRVTNGTISRSQKIRVLRGGETVYTGTLHSLKNVKKDVTEMRKGTECGMGFEDWEDFQEGDQIQCFEEIEEKRTLY